MMPTNTPEALLTLQRDPATRMGAERIRLLQAIQDDGSISAAARTVGLSYKAAWDGVNAMNNLFNRPLVASHPGGRRGGGATLTAAGEQVVRAYSRLQTDLADFMQRLQGALDGKPEGMSSNFLWSLMMKTSSRNTFLCRINHIKTGAVNSEVSLELTDGQQLVAVITTQSAGELDLAAGKECFALIKSTFVILANSDENLRTSARNTLTGKVVAVETGEVSTEVHLDLGGGKTLVAVITTDSADTLDLKPGSRLSALIKASHIILAVAQES